MSLGLKRADWKEKHAAHFPPNSGIEWVKKQANKRVAIVKMSLTRQNRKTKSVHNVFTIFILAR